MYNMLGEKKERRARKRKRFAVGLLILLVAAGSLGYVFSINPDKSTHPMDIVQGTGASLEGFQMVFSGPSELSVKWDKVIGQAWSIALVSGWVQNVSTKTVKFQSLEYRVKDKDGNIVWEEQDSQFTGEISLGPGEYIDFDVMPICKRAARIFELVAVGAEVINQ